MSDETSPKLDQRAYDLLTTSVKRFNEYKANQPSPPELPGAQLAHMRLAKADLSGVNLKGADLSGADLTGANLQSAVLYRANLTGASLARGRLDQCYAAEACFDDTDCSQLRASEANFSRSSFARARLDHARLLDVSFEGAHLPEVSLVGALLVRTPLPEADAPSINLREAVIETGHDTPFVPSVDFSYIDADTVTFAVGQAQPRLGVDDSKVSPIVRNLRKLREHDMDTIRSFAKLIAGLLKHHHRLGRCDAVACVPPSNPEKMGHNPSRSLCEEVARLAGKHDGSAFLLRHKAVISSGILSLFSDEGKHLDSIKVAHPDLVSGRTILLVDDYMDTGCTFRAARALLLASGARQVYCLAVARRLPVAES
jgi:Pentapeptide repeats (8 copies)